MKKNKTVVTLLLAIVLMLSFGSSSFAAVPTIQSKQTNLTTASSSTLWIQTKEIVSKNTGEVIGYASLEYTKKTVGGRPQFDVVSIGISFLDYYRGSHTVENATGDLITLEISYMNPFLDSGKTRISFTP